MRVGAAACAVVVLGDILFLATVDPSLLHCRAWGIPAGRGASSPAWEMVPAVALWAAVMAYFAIRWDRLARREVERRDRDVQLALSPTEGGFWGMLHGRRVHRARARIEYSLNIDFGGLLMSVMIGSVAFCALPVLLALLNCYSAG